MMVIILSSSDDFTDMGVHLFFKSCQNLKHDDFFLNYVVVMWNWCSLSTISFYSIRITFCEGELQCSRTIIKHLLYVFIILASTDFGRYMADYYTDNTIMFCYVDPIYVCVCVLVIGKINFFILKNVQIRTVFHTCR